MCVFCLDLAACLTQQGKASLRVALVGTYRTVPHPSMRAPPPVAIMLGGGMIFFGAMNAYIGYNMLGERGKENKERFRAIMSSAPNEK